MDANELFQLITLALADVADNLAAILEIGENGGFESPDDVDAESRREGAAHVVAAKVAAGALYEMLSMYDVSAALSASDDNADEAEQSAADDAEGVEQLPELG
jgi:hypothetical protein